MKVAIYLRVSTTSQDYERQRHEIENYCRINHHEIIGIYEEKMSGAKDEREQFNKLRQLTKDDIDAVIVWEISRLSRRLSTMINVVEEFTNKGISIITLKENFVSLDNDGRMTAMATMMLAMLSSMAVIERENILERSRSGKLEKLSSGELEYTGAAPYGYIYKDKKLIINESEAAVVREIYDEYIGGFSITELARLHEMYTSQVARILKNPVYCGRPYSNLLKKTLQAPQIVSVDSYTAAREKAAQKTTMRARRGSNPHPLQGKIHCEFCGHVLSKKGESWGCHCYKSSLQHKFIDKSLDMVLYKYTEKVNKYTISKLDIDVRELEKQYKTTSKLMYAVVDGLRDAHTKYDTLKTVMDESKLKNEKNEIARLENRLKEYDHELWDIRYKLKDAKAKVQYTKDNSSELIEKVTLHIVDRTTKNLIFELVDGSVYEVSIRMRKNEYSIKKMEGK